LKRIKQPANDHPLIGRLPPGRRGLKHQQPARGARAALSPSPRKAWIETASSNEEKTNTFVAFPPEGVD